jgi:hypothetical protein
VTSELTGEVSMGVLLVFLVFWKWGRYIVPDQQGDIVVTSEPSDYLARALYENIYDYSLQFIRFIRLL